MDSPRLLLAHTTCADLESAERLARGLVEAHIAACVSVGEPLRSIYPWEGRIASDREVPVLIKTCPERLDALKRFIAEHHAYEVPELLITPVVDGSEAYLGWAEDWMSHD